MIHFDNVSVAYDEKTVALHRVSFSVKPGEFVGIIGVSGSGKSTLLKCINQLVKPSQGSVFVNGACVSQLDKKSLREKRRHIGFIFQDYNLVERATVLENVLMGRLGYKSSLKSLFGLFDTEDYTLAIEALATVGLSEKTFSRANELSGGQKQRVAIAKALCQKPDILLADEPVASLDVTSSQKVMDYFKRINSTRSITVLVNLHDVTLSKTYCDRIIALKNGRIYFDKAVGDLDDRELQELYS